MKIIFINTLRVLMLFIFIFSCGISCVVYEDTLVDWWIPVGVVLIVGWIWLTTMDDKVINCCCHLVCVGAISCVLFLGGNYWFADSASAHEEEVMVQNKYIETHKKSRRVGRHRYVPDGVRKEYYLQVTFENGNVETLHVSPSTYNKTKTGRSKILTLQKGLFGLPVITKGL